MWVYFLFLDLVKFVFFLLLNLLPFGNLEFKISLNVTMCFIMFFLFKKHPIKGALDY